MGEVYRARDHRLGRIVALKFLAPGHADSVDLRRRFLREARAAAILNHASIVTIYEVAEDQDGAPYLAMELVEGETLASRLQRGPLPLPEALTMARTLADALAHAHEAGVIHRDLKPQNIMVGKDNRPKIVDFGLGKLLPIADVLDNLDTTRGTAPGAVLGTVGYMAPEQLMEGRADHRFDQFSFGAVLYEMLTGIAAFRRNTGVETLSAVLTTEPVPLERLAPKVPKSVVSIIARCLEKKPEARYPETRELVTALDEASSAIRPVGGAAAKPSKLTIGLVGASMIAVLVAVIAAWTMWVGSRIAAKPPAPSIGQIVVLPFAAVGSESSVQAFCDGLVELLTTSLTQLEPVEDRMRVVPASEVRRNAVRSAVDARQMFGATLVVSGSVQRSDDRVRLTLNVIDPVTLRQVQARTIDGFARESLALQDSVVSALAAMLQIHATTAPKGLIGAPTVPTAYEYYVQGRGYLQRFERLDNVDSAIELFKRAVDEDPKFALALAGLGEAYWRRFELTRDASLVTQARDECARALAIAPQDAQVHVTLGVVAQGTGEYEVAVTEQRRALELDPSNADAYRELARAYESLRRFDDAEATYKTAIQLRPGDWSGYGALGRYYSSRGRYDDALAQFQRVIELTPDNAGAYSNLGGVQFLMRRYGDAEASFKRSVAIRPTDSAYSNLGTVYSFQNKNTEAADAFEQALRINDTDYRVWANLGAASDNLPQRHDRAVEAFRKAAELGDGALAVNARRAQLLADVSSYHAYVGNRTRAVELARRAAAMDATDGRVLAKIALTYSRLGEMDEGLSWLGRALKAGYPRDSVMQGRDFERLRREPGFDRLVIQSSKGQ